MYDKPLTATVEHVAQGVLIHLAGEANMHAVNAMNDAFAPVIAAHPKLVVLDMGRVPVIGSLAMGALLTLRKALKRNGGQLYVAAVSPLVLDAFTRSRLAEVLNLRGTVEAALADGAALANGAAAPAADGAAPAGPTVTAVRGTSSAGPR